jgi:hypothetical protein
LLQSSLITKQDKKRFGPFGDANTNEPGETVLKPSSKFGSQRLWSWNFVSIYHFAPTRERRSTAWETLTRALSDNGESLPYWELVFLRSIAHLKFQGFVMGQQGMPRAESIDGGKSALQKRKALPPAS